MLACGDTYQPTQQNKSRTQGTVALHSSLFMAWLLLEGITTVVPSVNKDVSETSCTFVVDIFLSLKTVCCWIHYDYFLGFAFFYYNECFHFVFWVVDFQFSI